MSNKRDYYEILGIDKNASEKEIKSAYRKLAMKYHPDRLKDGTSDEKMRELNEAYDTLSDPEKKKIYDQYGHDGFNGGAYQGNPFQGFGSGFSFDDIFDFFGGSRRESYNGPIQGNDLKSYRKISFLDSIHGITLKEKIQKYEICNHCHGNGAESLSDLEKCNECNGSGKLRTKKRTIFGSETIVETVCYKCNGKGQIITKKCSTCHGKTYIQETKEVSIPIPAGVKDGATMVLRGYGEPGTNGGSNGDLYIEIQIKKHKYYERIGDDIYLDFPVSFIDIINENIVDVPTPYGIEKIKMKKTYTNSKILNIPKKGVTSKYGVGNLKLRLQIIIPELNKNESKEIKQVLEKIKDNSNDQWVKEVNKSQ